MCLEITDVTEMQDRQESSTRHLESGNTVLRGDEDAALLEEEGRLPTLSIPGLGGRFE